MSEQEMLLKAIGELQRLLNDGAILNRTIITKTEEAYENRIVIDITYSI